jgi:hypothetical protein
MSKRSKHLLSLLLLTVLGSWTLLVMRPVQADTSLLNSQTGLTEISQAYGGNSTPTDIRTIVSQIIYLLLGLLGTLFIVLTIFAGFKYMTSGGNEEKTSEAITLLRNAVIGLVIILLSWTVTRVVVLVLSRTALNNAVDPWTGL